MTNSQKIFRAHKNISRCFKKIGLDLGSGKISKNI
jgi:hypothetical protein